MRKLLIAAGLLLVSCSSAATDTRRTAVVVVPPTSSIPTATFIPTAKGASTTTGINIISNLTRFEDTAWSGGWRNRGESRYGGRTATWIYGATTSYSSMQAVFNLNRQPQGEAELRIEGMDSEDRAKTLITISINGQTIFDGPNPLSNDDLPLESGTWSLARFPFQANLLRLGSNRIIVQNRSNGPFGRPPFFMLDYAELVVPT